MGFFVSVLVLVSDYVEGVLWVYFCDYLVFGGYLGWILISVI